MFLRLLHYTTLHYGKLGKTSKKLVQVVQELRKIYTLIALAGKPPGTRRIRSAGREGFEPKFSKLMSTTLTTTLRRNML